MRSHGESLGHPPARKGGSRMIFLYTVRPGGHTARCAGRFGSLAAWGREGQMQTEHSVQDLPSTRSCGTALGRRGARSLKH